MAGTATKWLMGCGIGCLAVIIIAGAVAGGGFLCVKSTISNMKQVEKTQQQLEEQFGGVESYAPVPDGSIEAGRMEAFLAVRATLVEMHSDISRTFESLPHESFEDRGTSAREIVSIVKAATTAVPLIARYIQTRNEALIEQQMSFGEYLYIYTVAYHSWLGFSPADSPEHVGGHADRADSGTRIRLFDSDSSFGRETALSRYNRQVLTILRNQLNGMPMDLGGARDSSQRTRLEREIELLEGDHERTPWQDGLPESIERSLLPYRSQLEDTYCKTANIFDMFSPEDGDWEYTIQHR